MRARFALVASGIAVTLREVVLRDKPPQLLAISAKGTVPVLHLANGHIIDESLDIMVWALSRHDPDNWLSRRDDRLIAETDGAFKQLLDRYKYAARFTDADPIAAREAGLAFLTRLNARLRASRYLSGRHCGMTDIAIFPFVRQFAATDNDWFSAQPLALLHDWIARIASSEAFAIVMHRYARWHPEDEPMAFPI